MNKKKSLLFLIALFILLPHTIYADCTKEEINHFKEIEDEYKVTYEFNKETKKYDLKLINPEPEKYIFVMRANEGFKCEKIDENQKQCKDINPGEYDIFIFGISDTCKDTIKTIKIKLNKYNQYSEDPICEGIEEFVLCQPTYDKEIDYDTFVSRVNTYKKTKNSMQQESKDENNKEDTVLNYLKGHMLNTIIITVFIISVIITVILSTKSLKKSRRLE